VLRFFFLCVVLLAASGPCRADEPWQGRVLHACEDEEGYPPFTFPDGNGHTIGFSVDVINDALVGSGMRLEVAFLPTVRCNASLDNGSMDLSMEDYWNPDFTARWRVTDAIYDGTFVLFYDRSRHPGGLVLADVLAHPEQHHGCGLLGEVYNDFPPGQIDGRAHVYAEAVDRVLRGDCEFFPDLLEFGAAYRVNGRRLLTASPMGYVVYPLGDRSARPQRYDPGDKQPLYLYLRHDFPEGEALIGRLNDTVARWRRSGKSAEVMAHYVDLRAVAAPP
jgi:ABC-type amino acid transport substrate-binding protein